MFAWVSLLTAAFGFASELFQYINKKKDCDNASAANKLRSMKKSLKKARKNGTTTDIENQFKSIGLSGPSN